MSSAWEAENQDIASFYTDRIERHGPSFSAVDWGSREGQQVRFAVLAQVGDLRGCRVLDVGCGVGDFRAYLQERELDVDYTGFDLAPAMVEQARARHPDVSLEVRDVLGADPPPARSFDYVVASGIFYLRKHDPHGYVAAMARRMFELCRRGVAFNCLRADASRQTADEFRFDAAGLVDLCSEVTPRFVLRGDYRDNDLTTYLYRPPA